MAKTSLSLHLETWTRNSGAFFGRIQARKLDGAAILIDAARPIQVGSKLLPEEKLPVGTIEDIEEAVPIRVQHQFARLTLPICDSQNRGLRGITIPQIVRRELVVPFEAAGLPVDGEDTVGIKVVSRAIVTVVLSRWIAGRPVDGIQFGIVAACKPCGRTSVSRTSSLPGIDPGSPFAGTVAKRQTSFPVLWSNAATKPFAPCSPPPRR